MEGGGGGGGGPGNMRARRRRLPPSPSCSALRNANLPCALFSCVLLVLSELELGDVLEPCLSTPLRSVLPCVCVMVSALYCFTSETCRGELVREREGGECVDARACLCLNTPRSLTQMCQCGSGKGVAPANTQPTPRSALLPVHVCQFYNNYFSFPGCWRGELVTMSAHNSLFFSTLFDGAEVAASFCKSRPPPSPSHLLCLSCCTATGGVYTSRGKRKQSLLRTTNTHTHACRAVGSGLKQPLSRASLLVLPATRTRTHTHSVFQSRLVCSSLSRCGHVSADVSSLSPHHTP